MSLAVRANTYGAKKRLFPTQKATPAYKRPNAQTPWALLNLKLAGVNTKYMRNILSKRLAAIIGLALAAAVAAWQFYLFVVFKDANGVADAQGGRIHLWVAIGIALMTCIGSVFLISKFLSYDRRDEMHITSQGHPAGVGGTPEGRL